MKHGAVLSFNAHDVGCVLGLAVALLLCSACAVDGSSASTSSDAGARSNNGARAASAPDDSGPPELPRVFLDTRQHPAPGRRVRVGAGGDLQRALDDARPGDVILLQPGAQYVGAFVLPKKTGDDWITVESSDEANLPVEGTRLDPSSARLAKLLTATGDPVLRTAPGAHHYRIVGLEITASANVTNNSALVQFGGDRRSQRILDDVPHHLIIDRSFIHGHTSLHTRRCVALNSAFSAVIDSYLADCHDRGPDSQAICGWNGPGPYKIVNNYLEGAGENVMFGGGDPGIRGLIPSDIEIRRNYFFKPLTWKGVWTVKNLFELKNAQRVLIEGNIFENNWVDAQDGFALLLKSTNQDGGAPWSVTRDITIRANRVINVSSGVNILGSSGNTDESANHILIANNVFDRVGTPEMGGGGRLWQLVGDPSDVSFVHNTAFAPHAILMLDELQKTYITIRDNIVTHGEYGVFGSGQSEGQPSIDYYLRHFSLTHNVIIGARTELYPQGNFFPARISDVGFADASRADYHLRRDSRYKHAAIDGDDIGADIDQLDSATARVARR
jgi:hypothetical protein